MNTRKGFTLVELLVVIAILAILATVSVVGYTSFIENANDSVALQELTQIRDYAISVDFTADGNKNGEVDPAEALKAFENAGVGSTVSTTAPYYVNNTTYFTYVNGSGTAYWVLETGEVTTTAP